MFSLAGILHAYSRVRDCRPWGGAHGMLIILSLRRNWLMICFLINFLVVSKMSLLDPSGQSICCTHEREIRGIVHLPFLWLLFHGLPVQPRYCVLF